MKSMQVRRSTSRLTLVLAAAGLFAAACGGSSSGSNAQVASNNPPSSAATSAGLRVSITTHKGPAGTYLTDSKGKSLYVFALDSGGQSMCSGSCATSWPPLSGASAQTSGSANAAQAATIQRGDGTTQITYAGHPLYYYAGDASAGDTNGQGLDMDGGKWWLVDPAGKAITSAAPAASSSSSSTGSGWS
jgi:predicted lipoprotein with Yx(FWY)xxD motif